MDSLFERMKELSSNWAAVVTCVSAKLFLLASSAELRSFGFVSSFLLPSFVFTDAVRLSFFFFVIYLFFFSLLFFRSNYITFPHRQDMFTVKIPMRCSFSWPWFLSPFLLASPFYFSFLGSNVHSLQGSFFFSIFLSRRREDSFSFLFLLFRSRGLVSAQPRCEKCPFPLFRSLGAPIVASPPPPFRLLLQSTTPLFTTDFLFFPL